MGFIERAIHFDTIKERTEYIRSLFGNENVLYLCHDGATYYAAVSCGLENKAYVIRTYQKVNPHISSEVAFGYKIECEDVGPHYWCAPRRMLDLLTPTRSELALQWRRKCERTLKNRAKLRALPPGSRIRVKDAATDDWFCIRKYGGRIWVNERRTLTIPFAQLIQHELEILGVDPRFA